MSAETIAIVISAAGLALTFIVTVAASFSWMIKRSDNQFGKLRDDIKSVQHELVEVKIAVARIEGPGRHLVSAR